MITVWTLEVWHKSEGCDRSFTTCSRLYHFFFCGGGHCHEMGEYSSPLSSFLWVFLMKGSFLLMCKFMCSAGPVAQLMHRGVLNSCVLCFRMIVHSIELGQRKCTSQANS